MTPDAGAGELVVVGWGTEPLEITGAPLVPFHLEASKAWTAKSWDRTQVPKPGATVAIVVGEPYVVTTAADDAGREAACRDLEARLAVLEARAKALLEAR